MLEYGSQRRTTPALHHSTTPINPMGRSIKKGPFVDYHLTEKILKAKETKSKSPIKTWSRRSMITPDFVGLTDQRLGAAFHFLNKPSLARDRVETSALVCRSFVSRGGEFGDSQCLGESRDRAF